MHQSKEHTMQTEIWQPYHNIQVSSLGNVKTRQRGPFPGYLINGYRGVNVNRDGKNRMAYVHQLVIELFGPEPSAKGLQVNHIDRNKSNNSISNLEWMTPSENCLHAHYTPYPETDEMTNTHQSVESGNRIGKKCRRIGVFTKTGDKIREYMGSHRQMLLDGLAPSSVYRCCRGKLKAHRGFVFRYLDEDGNRIEPAPAPAVAKKRPGVMAKVRTYDTYDKQWGYCGTLKVTNAQLGELGYDPVVVARCNTDRRRTHRGFHWVLVK